MRFSGFPPFLKTADTLAILNWEGTKPYFKDKLKICESGLAINGNIILTNLVERPVKSVIDLLSSWLKI